MIIILYYIYYYSIINNFLLFLLWFLHFYVSAVVNRFQKVGSSQLIFLTYLMIIPDFIH